MVRKKYKYAIEYVVYKLVDDEKSAISIFNKFKKNNKINKVIMYYPIDKNGVNKCLYYKSKINNKILAGKF